MGRKVLGWGLLLIGMLLGACGGWAPVADRDSAEQNIPAYHVVLRGENLFRISWRYGIDYRDVARWNNLASPDRILAGQRLRLTAPGTSSSSQRLADARPSKPVNTVTNSSSARNSDRTVSAPKPTPTPASSSGAWEWPAQGTLLKSYNPSVPGGKGIQIGGRPGQGIKAASNGEIVYKGSGLSGYGRLIIIKHSESLLSAYGYLGQIFVQEGEKVRKGQVIAEMDSGSSSQPIMHFEIRKNGRPINPLEYLPS